MSVTTATGIRKMIQKVVRDFERRNNVMTRDYYRKLVFEIEEIVIHEFVTQRKKRVKHARS